MPMPPSVLALPPRASTIRRGRVVSGEGDGVSEAAAGGIQGLQRPAGQECEPQVLATSTTAVAPSNAMLAWRVAGGPATVTVRGEAGGDGGVDAAVAAVGEGQEFAVDRPGRLAREAVCQGVRDLGGGEAAFELVGGDEGRTVVVLLCMSEASE